MTLKLTLILTLFALTKAQASEINELAAGDYDNLPLLSDSSLQRIDRFARAQRLLESHKTRQSEYQASQANEPEKPKSKKRFKK